MPGDDAGGKPCWPLRWQGISPWKVDGIIQIVGTDGELGVVVGIDLLDAEAAPAFAPGGFPLGEILADSNPRRALRTPFIAMENVSENSVTRGQATIRLGPKRSGPVYHAVPVFRSS